METAIPYGIFQRFSDERSRQIRLNDRTKRTGEIIGFSLKIKIKYMMNAVKIKLCDLLQVGPAGKSRAY